MRALRIFFKAVGSVMLLLPIAFIVTASVRLFGLRDSLVICGIATLAILWMLVGIALAFMDIDDIDADDEICSLWNEVEKVNTDVHEISGRIQEIRHEIEVTKERVATLETSSKSIHESEGSPRTKREEVKIWRQSHPAGTKKECFMETGISKSSIYRYWD